MHINLETKFSDSREEKPPKRKDRPTFGPWKLWMKVKMPSQLVFAKWEGNILEVQNSRIAPLPFLFPFFFDIDRKGTFLKVHALIIDPLRLMETTGYRLEDKKLICIGKNLNETGTNL